METKKFMSTRGWDGEKVLSFFQNFNKTEIIRATLKDKEMCCHVYSLCYLIRAHKEDKLFFEKLPMDLTEVIIRMTYEEFLFNLTCKVKNKEKELFDWYFEDSVVKESEDIFDESDAVMIMRDQMIGLMMNKILKSTFILTGPNKGILKLDESIKNLYRYDSKKHSGTKYNCYKNHILLNNSGLLLFGSSMLFQNQIEMEDVEEFDSYCNVFESYLEEIMNEVEIDLNGEVNRISFEKDIRKITIRVLQRNFIFCAINYKPDPIDKFFVNIDEFANHWIENLNLGELIKDR